jgi:A/G-specific adenine glycosylase
VTLETGVTAASPSVQPTATEPDRGQRARIRRRLTAWFARERRELPWRRDRSPYRIWVSEVMLQQTQAATVVRFFESFLDRFPDLTSLAAADEQEVLRAWEGLGYYRRARQLHSAAGRLVSKGHAQVPDDPALLAELPGVGRYMLGAVLSQAFERRLPILEANSERVLCRLFAERGDPRTGPVRKQLWRLAESFLPVRAVGDFNQALMELGALVCTPTPHCPVCPLKDDCEARRLGIERALPARGADRSIVEVRESAVVIRRGPGVLLVQRPDKTRWSGMWEFPHAPLAASESSESAARRVIAELTGVDAELGTELVTIRYAVTHHRITMVCFEARFRAGRFRPSFYREGRWVKPERFGDYPVSSPQRRIMRALARVPERELF